MIFCLNIGHLYQLQIWFHHLVNFFYFLFVQAILWMINLYLILSTSLIIAVALVLWCVNGITFLKFHLIRNKDLKLRFAVHPFNSKNCLVSIIFIIYYPSGSPEDDVLLVSSRSDHIIYKFFTDSSYLTELIRLIKLFYFRSSFTFYTNGSL